MDSVENIKLHARNMRRHILDMGRHAGSHAAHMGGALSITDVLATLYFGVMNTMEKGMESPERDRCILSKGHGALGYYAALIEAGFAEESLKDTFEDDNSLLLGHPVKNREIGIEFTNGSLGMGLSLGVGVALASKKKKCFHRIFVIMGDGECNEGSCWEAFMSAAHFRLDNMVAIIDCNGYQLSGSCEEVMSLGDMAGKLKAFGWETWECDGHDISGLLNVLSRKPEKGKPLAIVAHTIKGKGFSFSENNNAWHHAIVTQKIYEQGAAELSDDRIQ